MIGHQRPGVARHGRIRQQAAKAVRKIISVAVVGKYHPAFDTANMMW